jgi:hypothetical protein
MHFPPTAIVEHSAPKRWQSKALYDFDQSLWYPRSPHGGEPSGRRMFVAEVMLSPIVTRRRVPVGMRCVGDIVGERGAGGTNVPSVVKEWNVVMPVPYCGSTMFSSVIVVVFPPLACHTVVALLSSLRGIQNCTVG